MKLRKFDTKVQHLKYKVLREVAREEWNGTLKEHMLDIPKKIVPVVVRLCGVKPSLKVNQVTREMRAKLVNVLKDIKLTVLDFRPVEEGIVTSGGVNVKEINPKTMESKLVSGLYFAGEILDVDAYTGGFNLQIAWSTGRVAGLAAAEEEGER